MATPDLIPGTDRHPTVTLPIGPFVSNRYHFGMLLGVADLETEQGYHRGKTWLHNAWLHGPGTVWGLGVQVRPETGEVVVLPGLALDGRGRELRVAERLCLDLGRWFVERRPPELQVEDDGAEVRFRVHVTLCAQPCLDRPVPAISEPCAGSDLDTAYSRTVERAVPDLAANAAPVEPVAPYERLRQFAGQLPAADPTVLAALAALAAAPAEERAAVSLTWFRRLAALDTVDLGPQGGPGSLFPVEGGGCIVLAEIAVHLRRDADGFVVVGDGATPTTVDNTVRPAHVRTRTIQELLGAPVPGAALRAAGPQPPRAIVDSGELSGTTLRLAFTRPLAPASVTRDAFTVQTLRASGWAVVQVDGADLDEAGEVVTLRLAGTPRARPVRVVAHGAGAAPLLGADGVPLSGLDVDARHTHAGEDAALLIGVPQPEPESPNPSQ